MKKANGMANTITGPLLAVLVLQTSVMSLLPTPVLAQSRSVGYTTQPYFPGRPALGAPGYVNPGYVNPGYINRGGFTPAYVQPTYGIPQALPGGNYSVNGNPYWYSNSGYYYPWANNSAYGQIIYAPQTNQAPTAQVPPLSTVFQDLLKYLDEKKSKGTISDADYKHLRRRATDLQTKYFSLRTAAEGNIDPNDEAQVRRDMDELGAEVSKSVSG